MSATLEQVTEEVRELSPQDRKALLARLIRELEPDEDLSPAEIEAAWDQEISRRLEEIDSGKVKLVPAEEVFADRFKPGWMKPVKFHPQAERELAESVDFYNDRVPGLGDDFFVAVKAAGRQIQSDPLRRPRRRDGTRKVTLPRFPYAVVYRDQPARIEIVAVAHGARRPGYWRDRL